MESREPEALDATLAALADPVRRRTLELLRAQPRRPAELAELLALPRPAVSKHLRVLRLARLVEESSPDDDARIRVYRLRQAAFGDLQDWLGQVAGFWQDRLAEFAEHVERERDR